MHFRVASDVSAGVVGDKLYRSGLHSLPGRLGALLAPASGVRLHPGRGGDHQALQLVLQGEARSEVRVVKCSMLQGLAEVEG